MVATKDWREEYTGKSEEGTTTIFKIKDGESETIEFVSDGEKKADPKYRRDNIWFKIKDLKGNLLNWPISSTSYTLLNAIKSWGQPLIGVKAVVTRKGSSLETKYTIEKKE